MNAFLWCVVVAGCGFHTIFSNILCNHFIERSITLDMLFLPLGIFVLPRSNHKNRTLFVHWLCRQYVNRFRWIERMNSPVLSPCKQRRNFASQSQWDRVNCCWLQRPRLHSPGDNVYGHRSCSRQQRSSAAYLPTSLYSVAIEPKQRMKHTNRDEKKQQQQMPWASCFCKFHRYQILRDWK